MKRVIAISVLTGCLLLVCGGISVAGEADPGGVLHDMGEIQVVEKGADKGVFLTESETVIDLETFDVPGMVQSVSDVVATLPVFDFRGGTDLVPDDDTLYMRGFSSKRFSTAIDGVTIRKTGGRKSSHIVDYALLPPWMFERIEVKPGPHFASYPGKSIGGVLNLVSKTPQRHESLKPDVNVSAGYGSYNTQNHNINLSGSAGSFVYDLGYQKYHTDGYLRHTKADIDTVFARFGFLLPSDGYITLSASYSDADREITVRNDPDKAASAYDGDYPVVKETTFDLWQDPTWDKEASSYRLDFRQPTPLGTWSVQAYYSEENRDRSYQDWVDKKDHSKGSRDASWETKWWQNGGKIENEIKLFDGHTFTLGGDLAQCYDGYGRGEGWSHVQDDKKRMEIVSGYAEDRWEITPMLTLDAGVRYEDVKVWVGNISSSGSRYITGRPDWIERHWNEAIPKSFLTWQLDDVAQGLRDTSVSMGVSRIWRAPDYHGDYNPQGRPAGAWLDPEHGFGCDLVFTRRVVNDIRLKLNYGYYEIKDFIAYNKTFSKYTPGGKKKKTSQDPSATSNPVPPGLEYLDYRINLEKVVQQTVEFQLDGHIFDPLSFYLGYAFLDFDNKGGEPAGETECDQRARHRVNAGLTFDLFENTRFLMDYTWQDEQVTRKSEEIAPGEFYFTDIPVDSYQVFDVGVQQSLFKSWGGVKNGTLKVYVNNVLDEEYVNIEGYPGTDRTYGTALSFSL